MIANPLGLLSDYHPLVVEGMGGSDSRDPSAVASQVIQQLQSHWQRQPVAKPLLLMTQGDPLEERGISAITPRVASQLGVERGLVCLDPHIADYHARDADRDNVILEVRYSQLAQVLERHRPGALQALTQAVDQQIETKNDQRRRQGKEPLRSYFRDFAMLQEVTKSGCRCLCGDITVAQTSREIHEFSVASFFRVGFDLGLVDRHQFVPFG